MTELWRDDSEDGRTVEVRIYQDGRLLRRELCESDEEATAVAERWCELDGVTCEVDDLAARHRAGDILEPEPTDLLDEDSARGPIR
ncbi:hypothetical protein [Amycolatopsis orientalis]|uniref:hypothetical protein n=1 Tax=Amycolatopsis orientalis TaxID=31958 RepID=UPI0004070BE0|nr:hypothetical protein [Amycolatopsis orientalis]